MTDQRRLESLAETVINVATGFILSLFVWQYIAAPLYNIPVTIEQNLGITGIFTVSAVLRGYCWRRFFSNGIHKRFTNYLQKVYNRFCWLRRIKMGLFDEVNIACPKCGSFVEFQSKAGDCRMHTYGQNSVPTEIAKDILNDSKMCSCGNYVRAELAPRSITTVEMVGV